jgi:tRNA(fMet)-specific endonuclease VapC
MKYLLDTNAVSDLMREHPVLSPRARGVTSPNRLIICPIVRGELEFGLQRLQAGKKHDALEANAKAVFRACSFVPLIGKHADTYGKLKDQQLRLGVALDENDLWIASIAMVEDATVVTRDKDFSRIAGLAVEDWSV